MIRCVGALAVVLAAVVVLALARCSAPQLPTALASDSTAAELFLDLHMVSAMQELGLSTPGRDVVLAKYGLDSSGFAQAMEFYSHHPDRLSEIYAEVVDQLDALEMSFMR